MVVHSSRVHLLATFSKRLGQNRPSQAQTELHRRNLSRSTAERVSLPILIVDIADSSKHIRPRLPDRFANVMRSAI